jgi:hypothetical protein
MRRILSLIGAALTFAACTSPTAPARVDQSAKVAKAKAALGAINSGNAGRDAGRLAAN